MATLRPDILGRGANILSSVLTSHFTPPVNPAVHDTELSRAQDLVREDLVRLTDVHLKSPQMTSQI